MVMAYLGTHQHYISTGTHLWHIFNTSPLQHGAHCTVSYVIGVSRATNIWITVLSVKTLISLAGGVSDYQCFREASYPQLQAWKYEGMCSSGVGVLLAADGQATSKSGYRASLWDDWPDFIFLFFSSDNYFILLSMRPLWRENGSVVYSALTH
jgi:hypothetical protein